MRQAPFPLDNDEYYLNNFELITREISELIRSKRADYGGSMGYHGVKGLMPRIADKFFRLDHLLWDDAGPNHEKAEDTALDLAVYAISVAVALRWEHPSKPEPTLRAFGEDDNPPVRGECIDTRCETTFPHMRDESRCPRKGRVAR